MKRIKQNLTSDCRGFSAVEALVSVVVLSVMVLLTVLTLQNSQKASRRATIQGDSQQSARVANDLVTIDLRSIGYDIDRGNGQVGLVHAGPWDLIFNANITPTEDNPVDPGFPQAIDMSVGPSVPGGLYVPTDNFITGAETIRYTLDSSGDGDVNAADVDDDLEEGTPNPRDYVLRKEIYGRTANGSNGGNGETVAVVRGPDPGEDGNRPTPLFSYWIDHDADPVTPEILHGDNNLDGELSQAEIAAITAVSSAQLRLVSRIVATVTSEDGESSGNGRYRSRTLVSTVSIRSQTRKNAVITGNVYLDANKNGDFDEDEPGIPNVPVRLHSGQIRATDMTGYYSFAVDEGDYTVMEIDPDGFTSTTPGHVPITVEFGKTYVVDFGDTPVSGVGTILGTVYNDENTNGTFDAGERGIENILVTLQDGVSDTTDASGEYEFQVAVGTHEVSESDSTGYSSTTSNQVEVSLTSDGEQKTVNFGDALTALGIIEGVVFLDMNADGKQGLGDSGIDDVTVVLSSGDSTVTNINGEYSMTVPIGVYNVTEYDLQGYSSSTPNVVENVLVVSDSIPEINFGDVFDGPIELGEVNVGSTDRSLAVAALDLREDATGDIDIVLGTQVASGENNLLVWHNKQTSAGTPPSGLFDSTPTLTRNASYTVPVLHAVDSNNDSYPDIITGLSTGADKNLRLWVNQSGAQSGSLPMFPSGSFQTNAGSSVLSMEPVTWPGWSDEVLAIGTRDSDGKGHIEFWKSSGSNQYAHLTAYDIYEDSERALGEVNAIACADFNGDGYADLALGHGRSDSKGRVTILLADTESSAWQWEEARILETEGAPQAISAADMMEDAGKDIDLAIGTSKGDKDGRIELWLNDGLGAFGTFDGDEYVPSDTVDPDAAVLALDVAPVDGDVFPEVIVGVRTKDYVGALNVYRTFGNLLPLDYEVSSYQSGEVITLAVNDLNGDGATDIVVGTRSSSVSGELILYVGQ